MAERAGGMAQVDMPNKHEALSSASNTAMNKKVNK
jgi:hypothetical protein